MPPSTPPPLPPPSRPSRTARVLRAATTRVDAAVSVAVLVAAGVSLLPVGGDDAAAPAPAPAATPPVAATPDLPPRPTGTDRATPDVRDSRPVVAAGGSVSAAPGPDARWDRLADCESGDWDATGTPVPGSRRWDYGLTFSHGDIFEGGLNFHPATWDDFRDPDMPAHAGRASRAAQIAVAERVLAAQGWGAWPVCSRKLGYR